MRKSTTIFALVLCFLGLEAGAQSFDKIQIETTHLSENVYMLASHAGGNLGVCVGEDGILLVDSEYSELNEKVRAALAKISDKPVKMVINTHWHFDHVGGNAIFKKGGSLIAAHENVYNRMAKDQHIDVIDRDVPKSPEEALPNLLYSDTITFNLNEEEVFVFHPKNSHTDGDSVVYFKKANVVHTGDIVFNQGYPFIDVSSGGSIDGMITAIESILKICDEETKIIPGHGPLSHKAELAAYKEMLSRFREIIAKEMEKGKDLETIIAERPTKALDEKWGRLRFPPHLFTEIVFLSLQKTK